MRDTSKKIEQIVQDLEKSVTTDVAQAHLPPPEIYWDEDVWEFEKDAIWLRSWLCLGRVDQIPEPGDYFRIDICDEPLLVMRGADGDVAVVSAVCCHRGNTVIEGEGNCGQYVRCPYHFWTYDLTGRLHSAPEIEDAREIELRRGETRLVPAQVEIWQGFIMANFDRDAAPFAPMVSRLEREIAEHDVGSMHTVPSIDIPDMPWNWKILQENFLEPYHLTYLHKGSHDFAPSSMVDFFPYDPGNDGVIMRNAGMQQKDGSLVDTGWGWPALFPIIEGLSDAQRQRITWATIPPMMFIGYLPDMVLAYSMLPTSPEAMTLRINFLFPPDRFEIPDLEEKCESVLEGSRTVVNQDVTVNTAVQKNMHSRFAPRGHLADKEIILLQFHQWLLERYKTGVGEASSA